jgi:hypothetical protein
MSIHENVGEFVSNIVDNSKIAVNVVVDYA